MIHIPTFTEALTVSRSRGRLSKAPHLWHGNVGLWSTIQGGGHTLYDLSGYDNGAALTNMDPATDWVSSEMGPVLDLDGGNDWLSISDSPTLQITGALTLAISLNFTNLTGDDGGLISKSKAAGKWFSNNANKVYELGILNDVCLFNISNGTNRNFVGSATTGLEDGDWHTIVATWDGSNTADALKMYFDGKAVVSGAGTIAAIQTSTDVLAIGGFGAIWFPFAGQIASVGIWNRALTPSEIMKLYVRPHLMVRMQEQVAVKAAAAVGFARAKVGGSLAHGRTSLVA